MWQERRVYRSEVGLSWIPGESNFKGKFQWEEGQIRGDFAKLSQGPILTVLSRK